MNVPQKLAVAYLALPSNVKVSEKKGAPVLDSEGKPIEDEFEGSVFTAKVVNKPLLCKGMKAEGADADQAEHTLLRMATKKITEAIKAREPIDGDNELIRLSPRPR